MLIVNCSECSAFCLFACFACSIIPKHKRLLIVEIFICSTRLLFCRPITTAFKISWRWSRRYEVTEVCSINRVRVHTRCCRKWKWYQWHVNWIKFSTIPSTHTSILEDTNCLIMPGLQFYLEFLYTYRTGTVKAVLPKIKWQVQNHLSMKNTIKLLRDKWLQACETCGWRDYWETARRERWNRPFATAGYMTHSLLSVQIQTIHSGDNLIRKRKRI